MLEKNLFNMVTVQLDGHKKTLRKTHLYKESV